MTDVVGLRFVTEGADEALAKLRAHRQAVDHVARVNKQLAAEQGIARWAQQQAGAFALLQREMQKTAGATSQLRATSTRFAQTAVVSADATNRLRQQFLATANSIAILDGPLGGIASRFSAFGILIGRTGLMLGAALVGFAALGAVLNRGIRNLVEWEASTARINAVLETTGYQAGLTGAAIQQMTSQIALATLESEQGMRAAAARLLTFRDIAGDVFEDVLRSATDMAALGFGTVESEAVKLAKALEDPAQALTSLSRAGIVFTRQQRSVIISLVESGRRAEAMERILDNVRARTQGAAEAAAAGTLAGAFDTIGQAVGRATREFAGFILRVTGVQAAVQMVAEGVADYAAGPESAADAIRRLRAEITSLERSAAQSGTVTQQLSRAFSGIAPGAGVSAGLSSREAQQRLALRREELATAEAQFQLEQQTLRVRQAMTQVSRDAEGLDNLRAEFDLREQLIGLSEDEARVRRMLAQEGLLNLDVAERLARVEARRADLLAQGMAQGEINAVLLEYERNLNRVETTARELVELAERERDARNAITAAADAEGRLERLTAEIAYMEQGLNLEQARAFATQDASLRLVEQVLATEKLTAEQRASLQAHMKTLNALNEQQAVQDAIVERQREISELADRVQSIDDENALLTEQLRLLDEGVEFTLSLRRAEINLAIARAETLAMTAKTTEEMEAQLAIANALRAAAGENEVLRAAVDARRPARGGGGGRAGREDPTLAGVLSQLEEEARRRIALIGLRDNERRVLEAIYAIEQQLGDARANYSEAAIRQAAEQIAALETLAERAQRYADTARAVENAFGNAFASFVTGAASARDAISGLLRNLAQLLANSAWQGLMRHTGGFGGTGVLGTIISGLFGGGATLASANGNIFNGGNVVPFARGGVVNRPTRFPMADGRTGLMGEAGPEAIVPLKRGRNGQLGIQSEASPTREITVNVRTYVDDDAKLRTVVESISGATASRAVDQNNRHAVPALVKRTVADMRRA